MIALALAATFFLHDGDNVVFYGDSITEHQRYSGYVEAFVRTRLPKLKVKFMGAGWAGDTAHGTSGWDLAGGSAEERVAKDVAPRNPTVVTVMLGMNDAYYSPVNQEWLGWFRKEYDALVTNIETVPSKPRLFLMAPTPWDDFTRAPSYPESIKHNGGGYNDTLAVYSKEVELIAQKHRAGYVDLNSTTAAVLKAAAKINQKRSQYLISDWIHPDWSGALIPAVEIVEKWGLPSLVSDVSLSASTKSVLKHDGAEVKGFDGLTWQQLDAALPLPYDAKDQVTALAAESSRIEERLNHESLTVAGLAQGTYRLEIDKTPVGTFTSDQLQTGVSLGSLDTPMRKDAMKALDLVKQKDHIQQVRWREVERRYVGTYQTAPKVVTALMRLESELETNISKVVQPKWHQFKLVPVPTK